MTLKQAIKVLKKHNNWRRGGLSKEGTEEMREQIGELRKEWQRFCECEAPLVRGYGDDEYCGLCQKRFME